MTTTSQDAAIESAVWDDRLKNAVRIREELHVNASVVTVQQSLISIVTVNLRKEVQLTLIVGNT